MANTFAGDSASSRLPLRRLSNGSKGLSSPASQTSESSSPSHFSSDSSGPAQGIWEVTMKLVGDKLPRKKRKRSVGADSAVRSHWLGRWDCTVSLIAASIGLGNLLDFPYLFYKYGASTFLIPFVLITIVVGLPVFYMEACLGQLTGQGAVLGWHMAPLFKGVGFSIGVTCIFMSVYYAVFCIYPLFYLGSSFLTPLPWATCDNEWNTDECMFIIDCIYRGQTRKEDGRCYGKDGFLGFWSLSKYKNITGRSAVFSSQEFWIENVEGNEDRESLKLGSIQGSLVACLFVVWLLCFLVLSRDIHHIGKIMAFNALMMYLVLIVLVGYGITLENTSEGLKYYWTPRWDLWLQFEVWLDASGQALYGILLGVGVVSTITSFSCYDHGDPFRMAVVVVVLDSVTSIFSGFVFLTHMTSMSSRLGHPVEEFTELRAGSQLAYIVFTESISHVKVGPFLSIILFGASIGLGITSEVAILNVIVTTVMDVAPLLRRRKVYVVLLMCLAGFLVCLPFTMKGGVRWATLLSNHVGTFSLIVNGLMEVLVVAWVYGIDEFCTDVETMIEQNVSPYIKWCWKFVIPVYLLTMLIWTWIRWDVHACSTGIAISIIPFLAVMLTILCQLYHTPGEDPWLQKCKLLLQPDNQWNRSWKPGDTLSTGDSVMDLAHGSSQSASITTPGSGQTITSTARWSSYYTDSSTLSRIHRADYTSSHGCLEDVMETSKEERSDIHSSATDLHSPGEPAASVRPAPDVIAHHELMTSPSIPGKVPLN